MTKKTRKGAAPEIPKPPLINQDFQVDLKPARFTHRDGTDLSISQTQGNWWTAGDLTKLELMAIAMKIIQYLAVIELTEQQEE